MLSITLNPSGGHLGDGEGFMGFFFFLTGAFFVGVAFFVAVAFGVGVEVAFTVAVADGLGVFVAARACAGMSARQSPITIMVRFIDHSI
jgi:hypothetical protein